MWCGVIWNDVMWCDMIWCDMKWCGMIWCDVMWCGVMWYDVMCYEVGWDDVKVVYDSIRSSNLIGPLTHLITLYSLLFSPNLSYPHFSSLLPSSRFSLRFSSPTLSYPLLLHSSPLFSSPLFSPFSYPLLPSTTLYLSIRWTGNVIRYLVLKALQLDPHAWLRLAVYNG